MIQKDEFKDKAVKNNRTVVDKAVSEIKLRQLQIKKEQDFLLEQNKMKYEDVQDLSGEGLAKKVKEDLSIDQQYFKTFQDSLDLYHSKGNVLSTIKTNKMKEIFLGTNLLFDEDETNIAKIANGSMPTTYSNAIIENELPALIDNPEHLQPNQFWGTSRITYLTSAILALNFTLYSHTINDIPLDSAITHVSLLPSDLVFDHNCRFAYIWQAGSQGFGYIHSGFSFGGYRFEKNMYPNGKSFGPEDCSSWVSKITGFPYEFDTSDQVCAFRSQTSGFVPEQWKTTSLSKKMESFFSPVATDAVIPGDVFIYRDFNLTAGDPESNLGVSGHTAIVLEQLDSFTVRTLCFTRNMPHMEGFGIKDYSIYPPSDVTARKKRIPMILRLLV